MMRSILAVIALVGLGFAVLVLNSHLIERFAKKYLFCDVKKIPKKRVGVILGTTKYIKKGKENYFYRYRIEAGAELFRAKKVDTLLLSGANPSRYYNEPKTMMTDLIKLGVPKERIILDFGGFRTLDSIVRAKEIFGVDDYILVSQPFHLKRAIFIAHKKGFKAVGFCAKEKCGTTAQKRMFLRELLARAKAVLDIYILNTKPKEKINIEKK